MKGLHWIAIVGLIAGCPAPDAAGGTETETDAGGSGSSTTGDDGMMTVGMTAVDTTATGGGSADDTTSDDGPPMTDDGMTTGADTDSTGNGTTGSADPCGDCIAEMCSDQLEACAASKDCTCWIECLADGGDNMACGMDCGMPPTELMDLRECQGMNCAEPCDPGGGTGTDSGGMSGTQYMECMDMDDCDMGQECNGFLNYCSIQCEGDVDNCPAPSTGNAVLQCSMISDNCILSCAGGEDCPDGMTCMFAGPTQICGY